MFWLQEAYTAESWLSEVWFRHLTPIRGGRQGEGSGDPAEGLASRQRSSAAEPAQYFLCPEASAPLTTHRNDSYASHNQFLLNLV